MNGDWERHYIQSDTGIIYGLAPGEGIKIEDAGSYCEC